MTNAPPVIGEKLPALDELVGKVPAHILGMLDDLFRAKFTGVRKYAAANAPERTREPGGERGAPG